MKLNNKTPSQQHRLELDIGLDISTATVGVCALDHDTGKLVLLDSVKLNSTKLKKAGVDDIWSKADIMGNYFSLLPNKLGSAISVKRIYVEANAKVFAQGRSSADTLFTLAKFNALTAYVAYKVFGPKPTDINVRSARKALGVVIDNADKAHSTKEKVRVCILRMYPDLPLAKHVAKTGKMKGQEVYDKDGEDKIDAYVIAKGGLLVSSS